MGGHANRTPLELVTGALNWWREAGVDLQFLDETHPWIPDQKKTEDELASVGLPRTAAPSPEPAPQQNSLTQRESLPETLKDFAGWWLNEPALDQGGASPRVVPRGSAHPELMVLVAEPESDDREQLLSGPLGSLLDAMLSAMGVQQEAVYFASVLPRNTPLADWNAIALSGMGAVTLHHISLVAPKRLAIFGRNILPLLGHDPTQSPVSLQKINHEGGMVPVIAGWDLAALLARTKARSAFWQRWLEWTDSPL
ncbi:hypothetical protein MB02_13345 [Croceicoccus estronivorus]|nr:hypothetical protein MB02_13345 [Croceicoccus estronivorus]